MGGGGTIAESSSPPRQCWRDRRVIHGSPVAVCTVHTIYRAGEGTWPWVSAGRGPEPAPRPFLPQLSHLGSGVPTTELASSSRREDEMRWCTHRACLVTSAPRTGPGFLSVSVTACWTGACCRAARAVPAHTWPTPSQGVRRAPCSRPCDPPRACSWLECRAGRSARKPMTQGSPQSMADGRRA